MKHLRLILCIWIYLGLTCTSAAFADNQDEQQKTLELKSIKATILNLKSKLHLNRKKHNTVQQNLDQTQARIKQLNSKLSKLNKSIKSQEKDLKDLEAKHDHAMQQLSKQQKIFEEQARIAYMLGKEKSFKMLLNQEDPVEVGRTLTYFKLFNERRLQYMDELRDSLQEIVENEKQIEVKSNNLKSDHKTMLDLKQKLIAEKATKRNLLKNLGKTITQQTKRLTELERDKKALEDLIKNLRAANKAKQEQIKYKSMAQYKHKLPWPVKGTINNHFGDAIEKSELKWHGAFIQAPQGTIVKAIYPGKVLFAGEMKGFGKLIIIDHGKDYISLYGRNDKLFKQVGDVISPNEPIATVAKSGTDRQSGLYFEVRYKGRPINPELWCNFSVKILNMG